jgi:hypothetical protein
LPESHAGVVEEDHLPMCGDGVDQRGVSIVEVAPEILQERSGGLRSSLAPQAPMGVRDTVGRFDRDVRSRQLGELGHLCIG